MKILPLSDIHLEFSDYNIINSDYADVLILAGDIMNAHEIHKCPFNNNDTNKFSNAIKYRNFLKRCSDEFNHVIYIAGKS